jgi:hypothetical protein
LPLAAAFRVAHPSRFDCWRARSQGARGNVLGDRGSGADVRTLADANRRNELASRCDECAVLDDGVVLGDPVVIAGDRPCPDVDVGPYGCVPKVGQVIGLGARAEHGLLELDEVSDPGALPHR